MMPTPSSNSTSLHQRQRAIVFNNAAAPKMQRGDYDQCIRLLSSALRCLKDQDCQGTSTEVNALPYETWDKMHSHFSRHLCNDGGCERIDDGSYFFSRPLSIPQSAGAAKSSESLALVTKIIMFNLALSHHMSATLQTRQGSTDMYLGKACKLYQLCYQVEAQPETDFHLFPALINNLGLVYSKLGERDHATRTFKALLTVVVTANVGGYSPHCRNKNLENYLENAFKVLDKDLLSASAA